MLVIVGLGLLGLVAFGLLAADLGFVAIVEVWFVVILVITL